VSKELKESLAEIAYQLQEQLKFYKELGLSDIGGANPGPAVMPVTTFNASFDAVAATIPAEKIALADVPTVESTALPVSPAPPKTIPAPLSVPPTRQPQVESISPEKPVPQGGLFGDTITQPPTASRSGLPILSAFPADRSLEEIRADIGDCTRCRLHEGRIKIVFGEGNPQAKLMFVGEGPGADEDVTGRPFVGRAGQLLDKIIAAIGYKRQEVYIGNVVKCRPPGNRTPERDEVDTCEQFLFRQIALIRPKVIVALGSPAFQCLFRTKESISKARGAFREWNGIQVMPTFHPAYLLRSPDKKRETWEDMKIVRDYLNSISG
jgi:uracil-DNA glycosylase